MNIRDKQAIIDEKVRDNVNYSQPVTPKDDPLEDTFFAPLENNKPFFKAAFQGFSGTGKTYTAALLAIGLHQKTGSKKPVIIFDTEKASKFLKPLFEAQNIPVLVRESRSLADLRETMKRCRGGVADILLIDSISHVYEDFIAAYLKKANRLRLSLPDWGIIKPTWKREFSEPLVQDPYHIIFTGRAGYEYDTEVNEDTGKKEMFKSGVKMKVEGETAYEPDMLIFMERFEEILGDNKKIYRQGTVIKDRSGVIDGKTFINPEFKHFEPAIDLMLKNPSLRSNKQAEMDAAGLFATEEDRYEYNRQRKATLEEIEAWLTRAWPSSAGKDKLQKSEAVWEAFKTPSWTAIENMSVKDLKIGLEKIKGIVEKYMKELTGSQFKADAEATEDKKIVVKKKA